MADSKISQLPSVSKLDGTEVIPAVKNGKTVKVASELLRGKGVYYGDSAPDPDKYPVWIDPTGEETVVQDLGDSETQIISQAGVTKYLENDYKPAEFSGLGRKILRKNIVDGKNILTQEVVSNANTVYVVKYDFDLNGATIAIPAGCVLDFQGGSISNGESVFANTRLAGDVKVYTSISGTIIGDLIATDFGIDSTGNTDVSDRVSELLNVLNASLPSGNFAFAQPFSIKFPRGNYLFNSRVVMPKKVSMVGEGKESTIFQIDIAEQSNYAFGFADGAGATYLDVEGICFKSKNGDIATASGYCFDTPVAGYHSLHFRFAACAFHYFVNAIKFSNSYWGRITGCAFWFNNDAVILKDANSSNISDNLFRGSHNSSLSIFGVANNGIQISGNDFSDSQEACLRVRFISGSSIIGNYFEPSTGGYSIKSNHEYSSEVTGSAGFQYCLIAGNCNLVGGGEKCIYLTTKAIFRSNICDGTLAGDYTGSRYGSVMAGAQNRVVNASFGATEAEIKKRLGIGDTYTIFDYSNPAYKLLFGELLYSIQMDKDGIRRRGNSISSRSETYIRDGFVYLDSAAHTRLTYSAGSYVNSDDMPYPQGYTIASFGVTSARPDMATIMGAVTGKTSYNNKFVGFRFFDTTLGKPIWWNGSAWVDSTGAAV